MTRRYLLGVLLLLAVSSNAAERSTSIPPSPSSAPIAGGDAVTPISLDAEVVAAMQSEIDARIEAGQKSARELHQKILAATGSERLALARQSQELNESLYLDILRIQARHTRAAGFVEAATRIESAIEARIEARQNPASRVETVKREREHPVQAGGGR